LILIEIGAEQAMEPEGRTETVATQAPERREIPRFALDEEATLLLVSQSRPVPCRLADLSFAGCRLRAQERLRVEILSRVEVSFKINGIAFRLSALVEWGDGGNEVGLCFVGLSQRRQAELAEVIRELEADHAGGDEAQASEPPAGDQPGKQSGEPKGIHAVVAQPVSLAPVSAAKPVPAATRGERRKHCRFEVESSAVIFLINVRSALRGRIINLSMGGCRIRTEERFPVGIYTRVETEFRIEGLPVRLAGVIQAIIDRHNVGIRFLDVSDRKRALLMQLIAEIEES
jgi:hypothetical protein